LRTKTGEREGRGEAEGRERWRDGIGGKQVPHMGRRFLMFRRREER
jgi:hypothetical protein